MPTYAIKAPNGKTYQIDGPAGANDEDVRREVLRQFPDAAARAAMRAAEPARFDRSGAPSILQRRSAPAPSTGMTFGASAPQGDVVTDAIGKSQMLLPAKTAKRINTTSSFAQPQIKANGTGNVGTRVMQAGKGLGAGLLRSAIPVLPDVLADPAADRAASMENYANAPIAGDVQFTDINGPSSLARFIGQQVPGSIANMAGLLTLPGQATLASSLVGQIGQQRATNDGRTTAGITDLGIAAPVAAASMALDRFGLGKVLHPVGGTVLSRLGKSALGEGLTEGAQGLIEYTGGTAGTEAGFDLGDAALATASSAVAGAGMGGAMHAPIEGVHTLQQIRANREQAAADQLAISQTAAGMFAPEQPAPVAAPTAIAPPPNMLAPAVEPAPAAPLPPVEALAPAPPVAAPQPVAEPTPAAASGDGLGKAAPEPVQQTAPKAEPAKPAPLRPEPGEPAAGERTVRTPAGGSIRTRFGVVEASTLQQAEGANQNRDRGRETTDLQVQDIISKFDPEMLHEDASSDRGAPIVGPDGAIDSGNGRVLTLNKIYDQHPELAQKYRSMIEGRGFSTEGMERPVLVQHRVTDFTPEQRRQFVIDSNKDTKLELSPVERARSDADSVTPEMLATYAGGDLNSTANAGFVQAFNKRLTTGEMGNMIGTDRRLTQAGQQRIENAVVASAYGKPKLLERMMESSHDDIRSITGSLADVAGDWARMRAAVREGEIPKQYDITDQLADAAARVSDARKSGTKPADLLSQADAFDPIDPVAGELIRAFHNSAMTRSASRKAVSAFLQDYLAAARAEKETDGLFGKEPGRSPLDITKGLLEARDNPNGTTMFDALGNGKDVADAATRTPERPEARDNGGGEEAGQEEAQGQGTAAEAGSSRERRAIPAWLRSAESSGVLEDVDDEGADYTEGRSPLYDAGAYERDFAERSFTNRASIFNSAAEAIGMDPDKFTLLPAPRQVALLQEAMQNKYGVEIIVDRGMQERFAIDQMLDAFQNVQGMAHVLELPAAAISLGGKLKLKLQKGGKFLGAFQPGADLIMLPRRSNSFAHEWGHALDFHLLETGEPGKGLTGAIRQRGDGALTSAPASVREAFVDLLNAMFFDKSGVASTIMQLEATIAKTKSDKVKADAQAQIERLKRGNSQAKSIRTAFYKNAQKVDGGGEYWTSPTEMFARAFEAYVSYEAETAGLTTEFIGKGDAGYLSNAEERFALTFPKDEERRRIFAAFAHVFGQIAVEATLGQGPAAAKPGGTVRRLTDHDKTPQVARERGVIARELTAIRQATEQARKEKANRADDPKGVTEKLADVNGAMFMSMTGNMRMIQSRSGSKSLQTLIDLLTKQDGRGDRTVARTFAEDVHLQSKKNVNRLGNVLKANGLEHRSAADDMLLRDLLIGVVNPDGTPGPHAAGTNDYKVAPPPQFVKAAAAIRHMLDEEFYVNQKAGIDLGYTRSGYLARVLDTPKVWNDQKGFVSQASKVYEMVFDKEFGDDAKALLDDDEKLPNLLKLAVSLAKRGHAIASLPEVRSLLKQINRLGAKMKNADDPDAIQAKVDELSAKLEDAMGEMIGEVRPAFAEERAEAWLGKINLHAGEEHNASSPDSKYTKHRELPPEADKLMEKFYLADPIEGVTNYLVTSARRTAYTRRFGVDGKRRVELFEAMAGQGVSPEDQIAVEQMLDIATGRVRSALPKAVQNMMSFANAWTTMALLPRAVISSLAEPFTSGLVTGDMRSGFDLMGKMLGGALGTPDGKARNELARAMGIVSDMASDGIMEARYGQTFADTTRWDRQVSEMFKRTGLTWLTRAQKAHGVGMGHAFLDNLAAGIEAGGKRKDEAIALLRELGVRDPEEFSKELRATGRLPTVEEMETPYGEDYRTAQLRFSSMVIQEPDAMDRPLLAHNPVGRVVYGITGFSYAYWRNIMKRNGILLGEKWKRDKGTAALYGSALIGSAAIAAIMGIIVSTIREYMLNPERWEDLESKGDLASTLIPLGLTRTFSFGAADAPIQAYSGLKYQRDLANSFVGAGPGYFLQNATQIIQPAINNSRKTNTAEYNALKGVYSLASPMMGFGLMRIPGGPLIQAGTGAATAYVTSPNARDLFAKSVVGEKNTPKVRTPTALDKWLGPKPDK